MHNTALRRVLALRDLAVVATGAMGPAFSIATTMGAMVAAAGAQATLALAAVAVVMALVAIAYRALGERLPDAGSSYAWIRAAFGPVAGAYGAWVLLAGNIFAILATALPAGTALVQLIAPGRAPSAVVVALVAAAFVLGAALLLWRGLAPTAHVALVLVVAEIALLGAAALAAAVHPAPNALAFVSPPADASAIAVAMVLGVWMLDGWEVSASAAEESRGARHLPGDGGLIGLAASTAILLVTMVAFARVGTAAGFAAHADDVLGYVATVLGGWWGLALGLTLLVSLMASLQTTLVYLTRSMFAMGRDGTLPPALGRLDPRAEPAFANALVAGIGIALVMATAVSPSARAAFDVALAGTSWFIGLLFLLSAAAALRLFAREPRRRWAGVVAPGLASVILVAILAVALVRADPAPRGFILVTMLLGIPFALVRGRRAEATV